MSNWHDRFPKPVAKVLYKAKASGRVQIVLDGMAYPIWLLLLIKFSIKHHF